MCGICGQIAGDRQRTIDVSLLDRMTDSLTPRGPDDRGTYIAGNVGLGFRRLSIIDVEGGHQPMANEDRSVWIVFNGEVYNFPELRVWLLKEGHQFETRTDTETLIHLYEQVGFSMVDHLRGMFAFAIWDEKKRRLFCARDRFGIKPFFYHAGDDLFAFGSEIKAIVTDERVSRATDPAALDSYFHNGYIEGERTIYRSVRKLPPAHCMVIEPDKGIAPRIWRYWDIRMAPESGRGLEDWCEELEATLSEAVKIRLVSDVPLGAFLSGGIDSSVVVALMARHSGSPVKTFSMGFEEASHDELQYARAVARRYGTEHHEKTVRPQSVDLLPTLVAAYDEPFADSSAIPTYMVSKFAREHVTVVLSGDGGDELFAGYKVYNKIRRLNRWNKVPSSLREAVWGNVHRLLPEKMVGKGLSYYLSLPPDSLQASFGIWTAQERRLLYVEDFRRVLGGRASEQHKENLGRLASGGDWVARAQEVDMRTYLVDDILTKVDRVSMCNSLEARVPLLDHKVAELSFRMPTDLKMRDGEGKLVLKRAMAQHLPEEVLSHRKQGFGIPLARWFKGDLRDYMEDRLFSAGTPLGDYVDRRYVRTIVDSHYAGLRDFGQRLWSLIFLDAWLSSRKPGVPGS
jgi:asparagine synthase (glutamine-hydrolysing)